MTLAARVVPVVREEHDEGGLQSVDDFPRRQRPVLTRGKCPLRSPPCWWPHGRGSQRHCEVGLHSDRDLEFQRFDGVEDDELLRVRGVQGDTSRHAF